MEKTSVRRPPSRSRPSTVTVWFPATRGTTTWMSALPAPSSPWRDEFHVRYTPSEGPSGSVALASNTTFTPASKIAPGEGEMSTSRGSRFDGSKRRIGEDSLEAEKLTAVTLPDLV